MKLLLVMAHYEENNNTKCLCFKFVCFHFFLTNTISIENSAMTFLRVSTSFADYIIAHLTTINTRKCYERCQTLRAKQRKKVIVYENVLTFISHKLTEKMKHLFISRMK